MHRLPLRRRRFLALATGAAGLTLARGPNAAAARVEKTAGRPRAFELDESGLADLQEAQRTGRHSARSLVRLYHERIAAVDHAGPSLRAVIELNPDAEAIARALDRERRERGPRGPLHGIPVLVKDNIDTGDRMPTTAGSLALEGSRAAQDAGLVKRLRDAGAVILGKTNLSEWANFRGHHSTSGWSGRGGQTRNPYVLDRNPSGSSSGSAVAVAANLCAVAVGTETDGSIVSPSSYNGVVGLKPTVGLVSRSGIIPISATQDTAGPMARTVRDAAILLGVLAGTDPRDAATNEADTQRPSGADYTRCLDAGALRGARIGVAREFFGVHRGVDPLAEQWLDVLRRAGAVLVDPVKWSGESERGGAEFEVFLYEFKAGLNAYLAALGPGAPMQSLAEIIEFNRRQADRELRWFGQEHLEAAETRGPLTEERYRKALATCRRLSRDEGIDAVMQEHRLDALFAPTGGPAHRTDWVHGDHGSGGCSSPAAVAGYPHITVPAGEVCGLPVGASFFGRAWSEPKLLALAYAFEQRVKARRAPRFLPSLD